ncbi:MULTISPECIES: DUF3572 family protein [Hyphomicrobiales]|uniref:DUF3572 family protein n=1 Tax=Pyruvatibacter mobilis TaxID=1712261 RepID=A0A845QB99_9HYPH|nr:DUF3572 family protein [Pyruvatibacter mobilis]NBG95744.1 DUF3572 family protein [Pyruvatibacter mobilis]QJD74892.1 DUF3572 family protein [Pyruvatibacter mobilis]GGD10967.1 hypothetical protein GCM10011587_13690 [Pyruvatibacter mobilis]
MTQDDAQILALSGLTFLLDDSQRIDGFLRMTGITPQDLRQLVATIEGQTAILDYLLGNESLLLAFTAEQGCPDDAPARARRTLTGRAFNQDWTSI